MAEHWTLAEDPEITRCGVEFGSRSGGVDVRHCTRALTHLGPHADLYSATDDPPHRRLRLDLHLEADDLHSMAGALMDIAVDLEQHGEERSQTSGGWASGHHFTLTCDPDQDGDRFRSQLEEWRKARLAELAAEDDEVTG